MPVALVTVAPVVAVAAGYLAIKNTTAVTQEIVALSSDRASRVELHSHSHVDGVMRMRKVDSLPIPAGETVALEPGGYHLMLFGVEQGLQVDDSVRVELQLASGEAVVAHLRARPMRGKKKQ